MGLVLIVIGAYLAVGAVIGLLELFFELFWWLMSRGLIFIILLVILINVFAR